MDNAAQLGAERNKLQLEKVQLQHSASAERSELERTRNQVNDLQRKVSECMKVTVGSFLEQWISPKGFFYSWYVG